MVIVLNHAPYVLKDRQPHITRAQASHIVAQVETFFLQNI